ncbi:transposase [Candidatus Pacearchaeota archaeon]|nr:transposase [Candidatus Pacearchaeota archaeon]
MKLKKRKYIDNRNWKAYNEELVLRGVYYINPEFLYLWNDEIKKMNAGKIGEPYLYPDSMIRFLAVLHCKGNDFRTLEGMMRGIRDISPYEFPIIDYSQICRRFNKLEISFEVMEEDMKDYLEAGVDGSGEKSTKRGGWMREKWKIRKGWIKVVIMGVKGKKGKYVIDIRVGNEDIDERAIGRTMATKNQKHIGVLYEDGLHDCVDTFNLCKKYGIATAIKIRENASLTTRGCSARKEEIVIFKSMPYEEWSREKNYGQR